MTRSRGGGGIRHRNTEYDPRRALFRLVVAIVVVVGVLLVSVQSGLVGVIAEGVGESMYTPPATATDQPTRSQVDSDDGWRLSLNRSLDAKYTTASTVEPLKIRTTELEVLAFVNAQRAERGTEPLFWNGELSRLNRWYAGEIHKMGGGNSSHFNQETKRFVDERAKWAGYPVEQCTRYGEVITTSVYLRGFERTEKNAATVTEAWMRSDSHRKAILNQQYDVAGVGIFVAADDTRIAVMTLCDRSDIPDEELNGWKDAQYQGNSVAIPYDVAVANGDWDSRRNLTETSTPDNTTA